ncbi:tripartite tricarboxylate transporter TctB family protein [Alcaligenes sp. SDU_A2]|uniref:tripartite tricarboxylate transporter TctB family protein n=1 Tax=Alcaligenes sp. SDU_A2 TaxID=3136634 RepID=UPI00404A6D82
MNDRVLGVGALAAAALITAFGYDLEPPFSYEPVGPKAFPLLVALIIALCGLRLVIKGGGQVQPNPPGANGRILLMVAYLAGYACLFQWLGFIVSTALMATLVGRLFGGSWKQAVLGGVGMGAGLFVLFDLGLDVVLPQGILGEWL